MDNPTCESCNRYNAILNGVCRDCGHVAQPPTVASIRDAYNAMNRIGQHAPRSTPPHVAQERTRLAMAGMARFTALVALVAIDNAIDDGADGWRYWQGQRAFMIGAYKLCAELGDA
jgi:hypothetical protein